MHVSSLRSRAGVRSLAFGFALAASLLAGACAEPSVAGFGDGGNDIPCTSDATCPPGQSCQRGVCVEGLPAMDGGLVLPDGSTSGDGGRADGGLGDGGTDAGLPDAGDVDGGGGFDSPCRDNSDCKSGICIRSSSRGSVCSKFCSEDCPVDWGCTIIQIGPNRTAAVCFPGADLYCVPCTAEGCAGPGDRCSRIGDARYCTRDCTQTGVCPTGFECVEMLAGADGGLVAPPGATAADGGVSVDAGVQNEDAGVPGDDGGAVDGGVADAGPPTRDAGSTGSGVRQCVPVTRLCPGCIDRDGDGYGIGADCRGTDCNDNDIAVHPGASEACNLRDDNCDTRVDEGFDLSSDSQNCGACGVRCDTAGGQVCCNGACVRPAADPLNCGGCGDTLTGANICAPGDTCCSGACVNTDTSLANCGACSTAARPRTCLTDGSQLCCQGTCRDIRADDANCGGCGVSATNTNICRVVLGERCCNGVCRNVLSDSAHCGGCEGMPRRCTAGTEACCAGACTSIIDNDTACGACGSNCSVVPGGNCCGVACFNKLTDKDHCGDACIACTGTRAECCNGGCADLALDVANCGACGRNCASGESCCGGQCKNLREDNNNCGACGRQCGAGTTCCDGQCRNIDSDPNNCGTTCGNRRVCAAPNGTCCAGNCVNTQSDDGNCGRCGGVCATATGGKCCAGSCRNVRNGDVNNCGDCGRVCNLQNVATHACSNSACQVASCNGGFFNVDGQASNGCECAQGPYEPNNSSSAAVNLGNLTDGGSQTAVTFRILPWSGSDGFDVEWFRFRAVDDTDFGTDSFKLRITVSGLPGNNYRMTVYRGPPPGRSGIDGSVLCTCGFFGSCSVPASLQTTSNGAGSMSVQGWEDPAGLGGGCDNTHDYFISIEQLSGAAVCADLTLTIRNG